MLLKAEIVFAERELLQAHWTCHVVQTMVQAQRQVLLKAELAVAERELLQAHWAGHVLQTLIRLQDELAESELLKPDRRTRPRRDCRRAFPDSESPEASSESSSHSQWAPKVH